MKTRAVNNTVGLRRAGVAIASRGPVRSMVSMLSVLLVGVVTTTFVAGKTASAIPPLAAKKATLQGQSPEPSDEPPPLPLDGPLPKIVIDEPVHDFGEQWMGPKLQHTFVVKNEGEVPLEILRVKPACGCTVAGDYPKLVEPGKSGNFPFSLDSTKLRGKYEKAITIKTNDPITPSMRVKLRGTCNRYVDVVPTNANFGKVSNDESHKRVLKITNNWTEPLELTLDKTEDGQFKFELIETVPGKEFELHASLTPPIETGSLRGKLVMTTNFDHQKTIRTAASATVPNRLDLQPAVVQLNPAKSDVAYQRPIRFHNYGNSKVKIYEATCDDPLVSVELDERAEGKSYIINLNIPQGYMPPAEGRKVTLRTDDPDEPYITIPLMGPEQRQAKGEAQPTTPQKRPSEQMVGQTAPRFALTTTEGKSLSSDDLKGTVTVLDFFAPNCGFCGKQIPRLEEVRKAYADKGVRFVAVSQTMRKKFTDDEVKAKIDGLGFKGELAIDSENTVGPLFKASGFPTMVVLGKGGQIDAVNVGNIPDLETRMKTQLDALLAGKPVPTIETQTAAAEPTQQRERRPAEGMVGKPAPSFSFESMSGKKFSNAELASAPATILNFVAPNCGFCKKQTPRLDKIRAEYEAKGVRVVNVAQTMRKKYTPEETQEIFKQVAPGVDLAYDGDNKVGPLFQATSFPTMVVVGKNGKIEAVNVGNIADLETRLSGQLDALIAGKPVPSVETQTAAAQPPAQPPAQPRKRPAEELVGTPAPAFDIDTIDGKKLSSADLANHPATVLNFVAPNCGFCKKQVPRLEEIRKSYEAKGVRFVNVTQTMRQKFSQEETVGIFKGTGSNLELAYDADNTVGTPFKATSFPTMVVVGKSGKIEAVNVGNIGDLETRLSGQLDALVAGKPIPAEFLASKAAAQPRRRPAEEMAGKKAPEFSLTTMDGKPVSNADFGKYKATVLNFVAPNCGYCKRQVPTVETVRAEYEAKGVRFVNVAMKMRQDFTPEEAAKVFSDIGSKLELATDFTNATGQKFSATSFPTMMVLDNGGTVKHVNVGAKPNLDTLLKEQLEGMLKGG